MNLKKTAFLWCVTALLCSCAQEPDIPDYPVPEPIPKMGARTVLAYIAADNSLSSFSTIDIEEMVEGMKKVDTRQNNLLVYVDRYRTSPQLIRICRSTANEIMLDTLVTYTDTPRNSVGVAEMKEVLTYTFDTFPASSYGFVMWSHGEGWVPSPSIDTRWIGQDTDNGTKKKFLNIDGLRTVLESQRHLDYVFFDACFMQSVEVAYELRHCADYFIGSPTEIPGPGAPYQEVVPALFAKNDAATATATAYFNYYKANYKNGVGISDTNWTGGVSISVLRSDKLDALANASRPIPLYSIEGTSAGGVLCYDPFSRRNLHNYYDMEGVVRLLALNLDESAFQQWKAAYTDAVVYAQSTERNFSGIGQSMFSMAGFTGVSIHLLNASQPFENAYYKTLDWYKYMIH